MNTKKCGTALAAAVLAVILNHGAAMGNCAAKGSIPATAWSAAGVAWETRDPSAGLTTVTGGDADGDSPSDLVSDFAKQSRESLILDFAASETDPLDPMSMLSNDPAGHPVTLGRVSVPANAISVYLDPERPEPSPYSGVVVTAREPRLLLLLAVGMAAIVAGRKRLRSV